MTFPVSILDGKWKLVFKYKSCEKNRYFIVKFTKLWMVFKYSLIFLSESKLAMETALTHHRMTAEIGGKFRLTGCSLTRITFSHLLANVHIIDLSCNDLTCISPLRNLVACRVLILDNNYIWNLAPLSNLTALETLSLKHNKLENVEQLKVLEVLPDLRELSINSNPICGLENTDESVRNVLHHLKSLIIR